MTRSELDTATNTLADATPQEILKWAVDTFDGRITLASSFGAEDVVLIDMLAKSCERPRIFAIDTGRLHEETYEVMERVRGRYGIAIEVHCPDWDAVARLEREAGFYSFRSSLESRHACCEIRKVEPLRRALAGLDAWITGLRKEQSVTRVGVQVLELDTAHGGMVKLNPLAAWTSEQVWDYIREHEVPYNRLHDAGFPSVGCEPCTRAVARTEHPRAGRWWWETPEQKECGLHVRS